MKLYYTVNSPYARKVRIAAIEREIYQDIEMIEANIGFEEGTLKTKKSDITDHNPSGRVPTLITKEGHAIFDSTVIIHYLDGLGNNTQIIPSNYKEKIFALRINALVDEAIDAMRLLKFEGMRPENIRLPDWINALNLKINRALLLLDNYIEFYEESAKNTIDIGLISAGCLMYIVSNNRKASWNCKHPNLDVWFEKFSKRNSMLLTDPSS
tara:strand:+ start:226 stop:858 length:633 start_codon:yes stop_codon:yes gene_type:complete